jgi:hypothetical protein
MSSVIVVAGRMMFRSDRSGDLVGCQLSAFGGLPPGSLISTHPHRDGDALSVVESVVRRIDSSGDSFIFSVGITVVGLSGASWRQS